MAVRIHEKSGSVRTVSYEPSDVAQALSSTIAVGLGRVVLDSAPAEVSEDSLSSKVQESTDLKEALDRSEETRKALRSRIEAYFQR